MKTFDRRHLIIPATLALALFLNILPYPGWLALARPDFVTLALFYWCLATPQWVGIGGGWLVGLMLDFLQYTLLGQHALGKALVAAIARPRLRLRPLWQQCAVVAVAAALDIGAVVWVHHLANGVAVRLCYWQSAVATALLWPVAYIVMRKLRQRSGLVRA